MPLTTQSSVQLHTLFGSGYVPEQHGDRTVRHLPIFENREPVLDFAELLKALRAALSLR